MSDLAIRLENVNYIARTGFFMRPQSIVVNLNIAVAKGQSIGLIGPNGAGKTTTIKLCAGIIKPSSGKVFLNEKPVSDSSSKKKIGLLTENQYFPSYLTLKEWLELLGHISGLSSKEITSGSDRVLKQFELEEFRHARLNTLSKGQTQRAGFAQALLHEPDILILDEPMSGLDPKWRSRIHDILLSFKRGGGTLLFSSHIMSDVLRLSDTIAVIKAGAIIWEGVMGDISDADTKYEVVFTTSVIENIRQKIQNCPIKHLSNDSFRMIISPADKKHILQMVLNESVSLSTLTPVYPEIEELFS